MVYLASSTAERWYTLVFGLQVVVVVRAVMVGRHNIGAGWALWETANTFFFLRYCSGADHGVFGGCA